MTTRTLTVLASTLLLLAPAAVIIRHDRDDAAYRELGEQLAGICHLELQHEGAPPDGEGVLIAPDWVLTAAHVGVEIEPGHSMVVVGGDTRVDVEAAAVFLHPEWDEGPNDIALVHLKRPVAGIDPVPVYRGRDEQGQLILLGGIGDFGTGETGPTTNDGKLRGATNVVDVASDFWLKFRFDAPPDGTDLEGVSGPGDSGGPALLIADGARYVVGLSSGQSTHDTDGREGVYGVREYYTRVSSYVDWIDGVLGGAAGRREDAGPGGQ